MSEMTKTDYTLINAIAKRTLEIFKETGINPSLDKLDILISLEKCHEFCPLDLQRFAKAEPFHMIHNVLGILRHLNHETGLLENCFVPRHAVYEEQIDWIDDPELLI
jgi:hypothetical protein